MPSIPSAELFGWDIAIVLLVVLVLFGGSQLPKLARSLGEAKKEFEDGMSSSSKSDSKATKATDDDD
jgi:sec-independent protein translocase protein TatA